jgi:hypothetical protein
LARVRFIPDSVAKLAKCRAARFAANRSKELQSPTDVASKPLPKSPVSSSQIMQSLKCLFDRRPCGPGKFVVVDTKGLLQQHRRKADAYRIAGK